MKSRGTVSVIVPVHNRPELLIEAVGSALDQTYPDVEVIVVDDGSTDDTWNVCQKLALRDERVRIRRHDRIGKPGLVREAGRRLARGRYIQYLDSDDLLPRDRFSKMIEVLEEGARADLAYCATRRYAAGQPPEPCPAGRTGERLDRIFPEILAERPWFTASVLYRRDVCDRAGAWSDLPFLEDVELDARIGRFGSRVAYSPEFLADVRDHGGERVSGQDLLGNVEGLKSAVRAYGMIFSHAKAARVELTELAMGVFLEDVRVLESRAEHLLLTDEAARCRTMLAEAFGTDAERGLRLAATIEPLASDVTATAGGTSSCPVRITNLSTVSFREGPWPIYLSYHLRTSSGELLRHDNRRTKFGSALRPGATGIVSLEIDVPEDPGSYVLAIDLVMERVSWFETQGTRPGIVRLRVEERTGRDAEPPLR